MYFSHSSLPWPSVIHLPVYTHKHTIGNLSIHPKKPHKRSHPEQPHFCLYLQCDNTRSYMVNMYHAANPGLGVKQLQAGQLFCSWLTVAAAEAVYCTPLPRIQEVLLDSCCCLALPQVRPHASFKLRQKGKLPRPVKGIENKTQLPLSRFIILSLFWAHSYVLAAVKMAWGLLFSIWLSQTLCSHFELMIMRHSLTILSLCVFFFSRRYCLLLSPVRLSGEHMAYGQQPTPHSSPSLPVPCLHRLVCLPACIYICVY